MRVPRPRRSDPPAVDPAHYVAVAALVALSLAARGAWAAEYGGDTAVRSRDELLALAAAGELDDDSLDALLAIYDTPIDPATVSVDELAQLPGLSRAEARTVVEARKHGDVGRFRALALDQLSAFADGASVYTFMGSAGGIFRSDVAAEAYTRLRLRPSDDTQLGVFVVSRDRVRMRSLAGQLVSNGAQRELGIERWHLAGDFGPLRLVVGNYACSFGEGLTFSIARRPYAPSLFVVDQLVRSRDGSTIRPAQALRGVAARLTFGDPLATHVEAQAFASYRDLDLYQYGEWLHDGASPAIVDPRGQPLRYLTIADATRERLAGAGVAVRDSEQSLGVVGYVAAMQLADPAGTFSPSSRYPPASYFGAVGVYGITQLGRLRVHGELARAFVGAETSTVASGPTASSPTASGGFGAMTRLELVLGDSADVSISGRYYGVGFDNPYTRAFAEPDLYEGTRARDERGLMVESSLTAWEVLRLAASLDVWTAVTVPTLVNARLRGRALLALSSVETLTVEGQRVDKNIAGAGDDAAYVGPSCSAADAEVDDCAQGARMTATARLVTRRVPRSRWALGVRRILEDTGSGVAAETRLLAHVSLYPWSWLNASAVLSQRLSQRQTILGDPDRMITIIAVLDSGTVRFDVFARSESRLVAGAERTTLTGQAELTVTL